MIKTRNIALLALLLVSLTVAAQPTNPSDGPIHGIIYLLLAGIGIGIYGLKNTKRKFF